MLPIGEIIDDKQLAAGWADDAFGARGPVIVIETDNIDIGQYFVELRLDEAAVHNVHVLNLKPVDQVFCIRFHNACDRRPFFLQDAAKRQTPTDMSPANERIAVCDQCN